MAVLSRRVGPGTILFAGLSLGAWWVTASLADAGALWLVPVGAAAVAAAMFGVGVTNRMRRRSRFDVLGQLVTHGRIAAGVIVEIPQIDPSSGGLIGQLTVKFADAGGVDRWVTKSGQWKRHDLPLTGDAALVLYDPERPADTSRMWVGPASSTSAADFARWHP
ncbi:MULTISPECIES: hypothetical protein [Subtercola]|uniref:Uncharacterized protein n=1 Tax=Subtercola vilae TaxID=2056433 RepID=A0A4T2BMD1_9MICO|nr:MULTISPECIES: hypothetical protein [Subtercola]MEA9986549.1 hypothetical protein [Subtercola sp. RTI3]TIH32049.1 hypothetical protein D4765_16115 [Subtercola vilae]